jgi:hypothetical protein
MSNRITIQLDYDTVDHITVNDITNPADFEKMINQIQEKAPTWSEILIEKLKEKQLKEAQRKIENEQQARLIELRKGVCNLELCYARGGEPKKCGENGYLMMHTKKGFSCAKWGHARKCMRVTATGRISVNRKRYAILDRFKLTFFKKAIETEIEKVRNSYKETKEQAEAKLKQGEQDEK